MGESLEVKENKCSKALDTALTKIIDEWYFSVSEYYITREKKERDPFLKGEEELKRFHDENGHRIKFAKGELDFTYGLKLFSDDSSYHLQISVNNKVEELNYDRLIQKLEDYYQKSRQVRPSDSNLTTIPYSEIFVAPDFKRNVIIEKKEGKADVIRINFKINEEYLEQLTSNQRALINFIQEYCVAPLRKFYAEVYRRRGR